VLTGNTNWLSTPQRVASGVPTKADSDRWAKAETSNEKSASSKARPVFFVTLCGYMGDKRPGLFPAVEHQHFSSDNIFTN
jgi:hypothetical protein